MPDNTHAPRHALSAKAQKALDYEMYNAFKNNKINDFKNALAKGANPNAHYEDTHTDNDHRPVYEKETDNCFKGEHLIAQVIKGKNKVSYLVALLEAGASLELMKRPNTVMADAAILDFEANGDHVPHGKQSMMTRAQIDLLFAAHGHVTRADRTVIRMHREHENRGATPSYAETVVTKKGVAHPPEGTHLHTMSLNVDAAFLAEEYHLQFDENLRMANLMRYGLLPKSKTEGIKHEGNVHSRGKGKAGAP